MAKLQSVRFVAYGCPEAQPHMRWLGEILLQPMPTAAKPNPVEQPFSMRFWAKTREHAIASARAWWTAEQARIAKERADAAQRAANVKSKRIAA